MVKQILNFYSTLLDILKENYTILRTMVVCINAEEAIQLNAFLTPRKKTLLIHENMKLLDILGIIVIL